VLRKSSQVTKAISQRSARGRFLPPNERRIPEPKPKRAERVFDALARPFTTEPKPICKGYRTMAKTKTSAKNDATAIRDALPFFKNRQGKVAQSYWNVTPSGDYATDLETGKAYARAFMPMLRFNAGASDLAVAFPTWRKPGTIPRTIRKTGAALMPSRLAS
jgi:hypothetical protein